MPGSPSAGRLRTLFAGLAVICLVVLEPQAFATEANGCSAFKWKVDQEQALFAAKDLRTARSDITLEGPPAAGLSLTLAESAEVKFALPPAGKPKAGATKGAVVTISGVVKPGTYQVTLSDEAWIDMVQGGAFVASSDHSGAKECPGVRKLVRFNLAAGPLVVQISQASVTSLKIAIRPVE